MSRSKSEIGDQFQDCNTCGLCFQSCEAYKDQDPRHIKEALKALLEDDISVDDALTAYRCTLCGYCKTECPFSLNLADLFRAIRITYCESGRGPLAHHTPLLTNKRINFFSLYDKSALKKPRYPEQADRIFYPGCAMSAYRPDLISKISNYLEGALVMRHECCGKPLKDIGAEDEYEDHNASMLGLLEGLNPSQIITACPNCYKIFKPRIKFAEVLFAEEAILKRVGDAGLKEPGDLGTIAIHDPCPFRERPELFEIAREFVDSLYPGKRTELVHSREKQQCCGAGGGVNFAHEELAKRIAHFRLKDAKSVGADTVVTFCVSCAVQFGSVARETGVRILHALDLLEPCTIPDYESIYTKSRRLFKGHRAFINLLRLSLQV
ncbi:MAG: (Fe-S)-binding protein [Candidatus Bathyarchaeia archaeon]